MACLDNVKLSFDNKEYLFPIVVFDFWLKKYGPDKFYELIEPVDGFHPNQVRFTFDITLESFISLTLFVTAS